MATLFSKPAIARSLLGAAAGALTFGRGSDERDKNTVGALYGGVVGGVLGASFPGWSRAVRSNAKSALSGFRAGKGGWGKLSALAVPELFLPAGLVAGSAYGAYTGTGVLHGAYQGAVAGVVGLAGVHGSQMYRNAGPVGKTMLGVGLVGGAAAVGAARTPPEYGGHAMATPDPAGNYTTDGAYASEVRNRVDLMGATGDIVFGLQNMRHG